MKTTIDIPDDLYRAVKSRSAMDGLTVRSITILLYGDWLARPDWIPSESVTPPAAPAPTRRNLPPWFGIGRDNIRRNADGTHDAASLRKAVAEGIAAERCGRETGR